MCGSSPPPALELPPLTKTQASVASQGFPLFCSFIQSLEALAGFIPAAPPPPTRSFLWRAGTKLGLLPVRGDESKSPQKGSCQGNPEPLRCLTFICFFFFVHPQRGLPTRGRWGCCLYGNPSRHVWRQGCQLDLAFCSLWGHVEVSAATQTPAHV